MAYELRSYSGRARATTLLAAINEVVTSFTVTDASTWLEGPGYTLPLGHSGYFVVSIDYGTSTEEKVLCSAVNTSTGVVTVVTRGYDGLKPASTGPGNAHALGATVVPVFSAAEAIEANYAVNETVGTVTTAGDMLVAAGANNLTRLAAGSSGSVLQVSSGVVGWSAAGASGYALVSTGAGVAWRKTVPAMLSSYRAAGTPPITGGVWTAAPLDTTNFVLGASGDQPTCDYTTNKGRFTINLAGVWRIGGTVTVSPVASMVYVQSRIVAGSSIASGTIYPGPKCVADTVLGGSSAQSVDVVLNVGDKVELQALTNVTTTFVVGNAPVYTYCTLTYLGPST